MMTSNLGDMARTLMMGQQTMRAKTQLSVLATELSTGKKANLQTHFKGVYAPLAGVEHALALAKGYTEANRDASQFADAQQIALSDVQNITSQAAAEILNAASTGEATQRNVTFDRAGKQLDQVISRLNTKFADRNLFAGVATTGQTLVDSGTLLADLSAAIGPVTTANAALAAADAWFNTPGGGFETNAYQGAITDLAAFDIGEGETAIIATRADEAALRDVMKNLALTALMGQSLLNGDAVQEKSLLQSIGTDLVNTADDVTEIQAGIGYSQERIVTAQARTDSQEIGYEMARNALIEADPYETATQLQQVEAQLETIFTLTARLSSLSLASVLR